MLKYAGAIGVAGLLIGNSAFAALNTVGVSHVASGAMDGESAMQVSYDNASEWEVDAEVAKSIVMPEEGKVLFNVDAATQASATDGALQASTAIEWRPSPNPAFKLDSVGSRAAADSVGSNPFQAEAGWVRFIVDYDLSADGLGSMSSIRLDFGAFSLPEEASDPLDEQRLFVDEIVQGRADGPVSVSGSWTSAWLPFSSTEEINAKTPSAHSFTWNSQVETRGNIWEVPSDDQDGAYRAYAALNFRYEVAPIPEPETYGLLGIGLGAIALAKRARQNRRDPVSA